MRTPSAFRSGLVALVVGGSLAAASAPAGAVTIQRAPVGNHGYGIASSGVNVAVGNDADNLAVLNQLGLPVFWLGGNASNSTNVSNGNASIATGSADATGNSAVTTVTQTDDALGVFPFIGLGGRQTAPVQNAGVGIATSGGNVAVGNESDNLALIGQRGRGGNAASSSNTSNGAATVVTGSSDATGNQSVTNVTQVDSGGGGLGGHQSAPVSNTGAARANSGGNVAVGNVSDNVVIGRQRGIGRRAGNAASSTNVSNGSSTIVTGSADATGTQGVTSVTQAR